MLPEMDKAEVALLRAALLDGEDAIAAFRTWRQLYDFEGRHEGGRFRMLPLLHANMSRLGLNDPIMARLRGVHLHSWAEGQRRHHAAAKVIARLQTENIPVMLTKGMALAQDYYPEPALRPMHDIDIMVPRGRAADALRLLAEAGWQHGTPALDEGGSAAAVYMLRNPGVNLRKAGGEEVDLHWNPLHEVSHPFVAEWFWRGAESVALGGVSALRPQPGPLLFHVISHGLRPNAVSPLRWAADATMVLNRAGERIDWPEFWFIARRARLEMRLAAGLQRLAAITGRDLPPGAIHRPRASLIETVEVASFRRSEAGQFPGAARVLIFTANGLRLCRGGNLSLVPKVAVQWVKDKASRRPSARD